MTKNNKVYLIYKTTRNTSYLEEIWNNKEEAEERVKVLDTSWGLSGNGVRLSEKEVRGGE